MAAWSASLAVDVNRSTPEQVATEPAPMRPCATLLLCRKLIESAFLDASRTRAGALTQTAIDAETWIHARTDWTLQKPVRIPSVEERTEYPGSFDWCCRWLGEDPDHVRQHGLPSLITRIVSQSRAMKSRPRRDGDSLYVQKHLKGWPAVVAIRARKTAAAGSRARQDAPPAKGEVTGSPTPQRHSSTAQCACPSLRATGQHLDARYEAYATYCAHYVGIPPMNPQLWRLYAG